MKTVKLSNATVEIIEKLNWGQQDRIRTAMLGGVRVKDIGKVDQNDNPELELDPSYISKSKYVSLEICVQKIINDDGTTVSYTRKWMDELSIEDGDILMSAVQEVTGSAKK